MPAVRLTLGHRYVDTDYKRLSGVTISSDFGAVTTGRDDQQRLSTETIDGKEKALLLIVDQ
jgi:hypothetical protein